jgi:hypothetical protein
MRSAKALMVAVAGLAMLGLGGNAHAQQSSPPQDQSSERNGGYGMGPWGPNGMMGGGGGYWMMRGNGQAAYMCRMMTSHIEGRLAYLKTELGIAQAQVPLWDAYARAARDNTQAMVAHCNSMMGQSGARGASLPDRLDRHEELMAAQLEAIRSMDRALKPLYGSFSETQKKTADELFWGPMGMMGMM